MWKRENDTRNRSRISPNRAGEKGEATARFRVFLCRFKKSIPKQEKQTKHQHQQESICEYLEKGVYTIDMFTKRNTSLSKEIKQLQLAEADLMRQQSEQSQKEQQVAQIIPTTQHILESYPLLEIEEKNRLWKLVLKRVTVYRSPDDKLEVNIYPNLPK